MKEKTPTSVENVVSHKGEKGMKKIFIGIIILTILIFSTGCSKVTEIGSGVLRGISITNNGFSRPKTIVVTLDNTQIEIKAAYIWKLDENLGRVEYYKVGQKYWLYDIESDGWTSVNGMTLSPIKINSFEHYKSVSSGK